MKSNVFGEKRVCSSCSARFFDLGVDDAACPMCGHRAARVMRTDVTPTRQVFSPPPNFVDFIVDGDTASQEGAEHALPTEPIRIAPAE